MIYRRGCSIGTYINSSRDYISHTHAETCCTSDDDNFIKNSNFHYLYVLFSLSAGVISSQTTIVTTVIDTVYRNRNKKKVHTIEPKRSRSLKNLKTRFAVLHF